MTDEQYDQLWLEFLDTNPTTYKYGDEETVDYSEWLKFLIDWESKYGE